MAENDRLVQARRRIAYFVLGDCEMPGANEAGVLLHHIRQKPARTPQVGDIVFSHQGGFTRTAGAVSIRDFAVSGKKTALVGGRPYYCEMINFKRLWALVIGYELQVAGVSPPPGDPHAGLQELALAVRANFERISPNHQEIMVGADEAAGIST